MPKITQRLFRLKATSLPKVTLLLVEISAKSTFIIRFYFISTDELLSILGSSDPSCVQEHMIKVRVWFCNLNMAIVKLRFVDVRQYKELKTD